MTIKITPVAQAEETFDHQNNRLYREFFGRGSLKYTVYPGIWSKSWGPMPCLGVVFADNEFLAEKLAFDRGLWSNPHTPAKVNLVGQTKRL